MNQILNLLHVMWLNSCVTFLHWTDSLVGCSFETYNFWLRIFFNVWPNFLIYEYCVWILFCIRKFYWHVCAKIKGKNSRKYTKTRLFIKVKYILQQEEVIVSPSSFHLLCTRSFTSRVDMADENRHYHQIDSYKF